MLPQDEPAAASPATLRILVADDHPLVREAVTLLIGAVPGWEVCGTAVNGHDVIAKAIDLRPDVIILDLRMPQLDALAAVRELKRRLPDTELVIFSGARADGVAHELFNAGAKSFVGKADGTDLCGTQSDALPSTSRSSRPRSPSFSSAGIWKAPAQRGPTARK